MQQADVDRVQEFRKCIECFLCQDVCHVLREHRKYDEFIGPRFFVYAAALEMHPLDTEDRVKDLKDKHSIGYCNITTCCRQVCPEFITITENAIIPLKERVVDEFLGHEQVVASDGSHLERPLAEMLANALVDLGVGSVLDEPMVEVVLDRGVERERLPFHVEQPQVRETHERLLERRSIQLPER